MSAKVINYTRIKRVTETILFCFTEDLLFIFTTYNQLSILAILFRHMITEAYDNTGETKLNSLLCKYAKRPN